MKRDLELIRKIVLTIEDSESARAPQPLIIKEYTPAQIGYHAWLLVDAGFAKGVDSTHIGSDGPEAIILSLTWAGHEFAEAARNENIWKTALTTVKEKTGTITVAVLTQLLSSLLRSALGLA
jgi:hypothetical protein